MKSGIRKAGTPGNPRGCGCFVLASPARFERAAFRLGGERSILLSYGDKVTGAGGKLFFR